jgi:hypothetical protein
MKVFKMLKSYLRYKHTETFIKMFLMLIYFYSVSVQAGGNETSLKINLTMMNEKVPCGSAPDFNITIQNLSNKSINILNIERLDLQYAATKLEVLYHDSKKDVMEDIGRMPSHFGEVTKKDYKELMVGSEAQFDLGASTMPLEYLPPNKYIAYIKYMPDPFSSTNKTIYESDKLIFEVIKNQECKEFNDIPLVRHK